MRMSQRRSLTIKPTRHLSNCVRWRSVAGSSFCWLRERRYFSLAVFPKSLLVTSSVARSMNWAICSRRLLSFSLARRILCLSALTLLLATYSLLLRHRPLCLTRYSSLQKGCLFLGDVAHLQDRRPHFLVPRYMFPPKREL